MILPRRLMKLEDGRFCEEDDPQQAMNFRPAGFIIPDVEAERIGLKDYLEETGWGEKAREKVEWKGTEATFEKSQAQDEVESKAVAQSEVEDKAVSPKAAEEKEEPTKTDDAKPKEESPGPGLHIEPESRRGGVGGRRA